MATGAGSGEWPHGPGEMPRLIRAHDWSATPLGPADEWPKCLRTVLDLILGSPMAMIVLWGPHLVQIYNDGYRMVMADKHPSGLGMPTRDCWPEVWRWTRPVYEAVQRGEAQSFTDQKLVLVRHGRPGDSWFDLNFSPVRDEAGAVAGVLATVVETTAKVRAEATLVESERRLRMLIEGIPQLVWRATVEGRCTWVSPQWTAYTGQGAEQARNFGWLRAIHPEDRERIRPAWQAAVREGRLASETRIFHAREGRHRWFRTRAEPVRDDDGQILEWLGTSTEIDDLRRLQQRQTELLAELQHRVRNTLAVVRSIAARTTETSDTVEDCAMHLDGRIGAFARVQSAVARDPAAGLDLAQMIADELVAATAHEEKQVTLQGPPVRLEPKAAETVGLAVHELTVNAVKFGALSVSGGRVRADWRVDDDDPPAILFEWKESGVRMPAKAPLRRGFGTELMQQMLPYQTGARVRQSFEPDGVRCTIRLPLHPHVARLGPEEPTEEEEEEGGT